MGGAHKTETKQNYCGDRHNDCQAKVLFHCLSSNGPKRCCSRPKIVGVGLVTGQNELRRDVSQYRRGCSRIVGGR
jgi:hypothetical protein